jgi:LysR family glycine cleavage system transcriptional activator
MARRLPPLNAVRAFEAAGRQMSFSKAADELHVTPAAISQQVKHLEDWLGAPLFRRLNRSLELTDAGRALLPGVSAGLDRIGAATSAVRAVEERGALDVNVNPGFAAKWLIPRLDRFRQKHPEVDVRISAAIELVDFERAQVDIAIRFGRGGWEGVETEYLLGEEVFPVCSPKLLDGEHPLKAPRDLRNFLLLHDGSPLAGGVVPDWRMWLKAAGVEGVDPNYGMTLQPFTMVLEAAIEGQGVALGRSNLVAADLAAGRLVRPFALALPFNLAHWLVYRPGALARPKVKSFRDWIMAEAEEVRRRAA